MKTEEILRFTDATITDGKITTGLTAEEITKHVAEKGVVIVKNVFKAEQLQSLKKAVADWGREVPHVSADDFRGNYHSRRAKVSNIQQSPHVFHDYNFNDFTKLPERLRADLTAVFEPLRRLYCELTGYSVKFGVIEGAPYLHPQLIHYPLGGGFFGRHNHNLLPQKIGFILSLSDYGKDYRNGGTCFVTKGEVVDIEGKLQIGDLCLWPNDVDHWVKQSTLEDNFSWESDMGRWVITLAYFDPFAG
jgi:hypothetical protein